MSVVTGKRTQGKLRVLNDSAEVVRYTLSAVKNEKVFPKSYRWLLSQKIADEAVDSYACIRRANAVNVKNARDYEYRRDQQLRAYAHLEALLGLVDVAFNVLNIEVRRIEYWTELILKTENSLKNWGRSDKNRYSGFTES
jgi:hypothetical protein